MARWTPPGSTESVITLHPRARPIEDASLFEANAAAVVGL
jgi:hypothetical protein